MNFLAGLETFLYIISSVMLLPVVASLVFLTIWVVIFFGSFLRELLDRKRGITANLDRYKAVLAKEAADRADTSFLDVRLERRLQEAELRLVKGLDMIRFVIRVGPALGLMGTLIPMGIALSSLAQGDMNKMAGSMVTAFTTVVVGLACSVAAYVMSLVKEKWVRADVREMEYETERLLKTRGIVAPGTLEEAEDALLETTQTL